jgi:hypothetical protein
MKFRINYLDLTPIIEKCFVILFYHPHLTLFSCNPIFSCLPLPHSFPILDAMASPTKDGSEEMEPQTCRSEDCFPVRPSNPRLLTLCRVSTGQQRRVHPTGRRPHGVTTRPFPELKPQLPSWAWVGHDEGMACACALRS